jgi:hypothetical protein
MPQGLLITMRLDTTRHLSPIGDLPFLALAYMLVARHGLLCSAMGVPLEQLPGIAKRICSLAYHGYIYIS